MSTWIDKTGKHHEIKGMETSHLTNVCRYIEKNIDKTYRRVIGDCFDGDIYEEEFYDKRMRQIHMNIKMELLERRISKLEMMVNE